MQKFLRFLFIFPFLSLSLSLGLDFQAETWDKKGNACLGTSKGNYVYFYNPQFQKLFIYKLLKNYPDIYLKTRYKSKTLIRRIVYNQQIPIRILKNGKIFIIEDLELGTKQVLSFKKVKTIGQWKNLKLKKASIKPKIKYGDYFWYGISYVIETQKGYKPTLTPLEIPPTF